MNHHCGVTRMENWTEPVNIKLTTCGGPPVTSVARPGACSSAGTTMRVGSNFPNPTNRNRTKCPTTAAAALTTRLCRRGSSGNRPAIVGATNSMSRLCRVPIPSKNKSPDASLRTHSLRGGLRLNRDRPIHPCDPFPTRRSTASVRAVLTTAAAATTATTTTAVMEVDPGLYSSFFPLFS